jgi:hypothetical protein
MDLSTPRTNDILMPNFTSSSVVIWDFMAISTLLTPGRSEIYYRKHFKGWNSM